jgi:hypothetical protein
MPTPSEPVDPDPADLSVELAVDLGQTKTVHRIRRGGTFEVRNGSPDATLTITSAAPDPPFVLSGCTSAVASFTVDPRSSTAVTISEAYVEGSSFTYAAQIEGSQAEDPIVIIERR